MRWAPWCRWRSRASSAASWRRVAATVQAVLLCDALLRHPGFGEAVGEAEAAILRGALLGVGAVLALAVALCFLVSWLCLFVCSLEKNPPRGLH